MSHLITVWTVYLSLSLWLHSPEASKNYVEADVVIGVIELFEAYYSHSVNAGSFLAENADEF